MRRSLLAVPLLLFALPSCATVFRGGTAKVVVESDPKGAAVTVGGGQPQATPTEVVAERSGVTSVVASAPGYEDHRGIVKKKLNPAWLTVDILTCVFPVALCIPLLVDAISGSWYDVPKRYVAKLEPRAGGAPAPLPATTTIGVAPVPTGATPPPNVQMSESERKSAARAAYLEAVQLQEAGNFKDALPRFEAAQSLFDAPTHILHIAQCQAQLGKLVEAQESYELLSRTQLAPGAAEAFRQAQVAGKKELAALKPRVPTLRIRVTPNPTTLSALSVQLNGVAMPNELVGIARPVNPGKYRITATASGFSAAPVEVDLAEGASRTVDVKLGH
ncbi:MAG: PEGA domain-containing protein [Myxococcales bacterium]|nr:PEGA domain-containing protein [Myxococcales bacterium]